MWCSQRKTWVQNQGLGAGGIGFEATRSAISFLAVGVDRVRVHGWVGERLGHDQMVVVEWDGNWAGTTKWLWMTGIENGAPPARTPGPSPRRRSGASCTWAREYLVAAMVTLWLIGWVWWVAGCIGPVLTQYRISLAELFLRFQGIQDWPPGPKPALKSPCT